MAIVGVILIKGVFAFWREYRAERAVAALRRLLPQKVHLGSAMRALEEARKAWLRRFSRA